MLDGSQIHGDRTTFFDKINELELSDDFNKNYSYLRSLLPEKKDFRYDAIALAEADRALKCHFTNFRSVFSERQFKTIFCEEDVSGDYLGETISDITNLLSLEHLEEIKKVYKISPVISVVGIVDDVFLTDSGTYQISEFKTGSMNSGTQSSIRKELIFYAKLLEPHLNETIETMSYHFVSEDKYHVEKIKKRSVKALQDLVYRLVKSTLDSQFKIKYFDRACDNNCQFFRECKVNSFRRY